MCRGKMAEAYRCFQVFIVFYIPLPHVKFAVNKQVLTFIISASEEKKKSCQLCSDTLTGQHSSTRCSKCTNHISRVRNPNEDHFGGDNTIASVYSPQQGAFTTQGGKTAHPRNLELETSKLTCQIPEPSKGADPHLTVAVPASAQASSLALLKGSLVRFWLFSHSHEVRSGHQKPLDYFPFKYLRHRLNFVK